MCNLNAEIWFFHLFRSHITMVKAVVVLNSSEGVNGTVYFTQEGDGTFIYITVVKWSVRARARVRVTVVLAI